MKAVGSQGSATIVWFGNDLRLDDNSALRAACSAAGPVIPVFIWSPEEHGRWDLGAASRWWLHQSLEALGTSLAEKGSRLVLRCGPSAATLLEIATETGAKTVYWNRRYEPVIGARDQDALEKLTEHGLECEVFESSLLFNPEEVRTKSGGPFQVFTPYWKACLGKPEPVRPDATPRNLSAPARWPESETLNSLELEPKIDWAGAIAKAWTPGEVGARAQLRRFLKQSLSDYKDARDIPAIEGTSRLSPHLHFGEIGPRRVWHEVRAAQERHAAKGERGWKAGPESYLRELGWRDFAYHLLAHFPHTPDQPLREKVADFPWRKSKKDLRAWQRGRTGYPIVDAGMRELWTTGWMHNRVRMIVGSFLVKDLRIHWLEGAKWFWDTLVDADLANNTLGWQWVAGCGADAAPYFRVFNPVSQGERFDPKGEYVRRWVPEIGSLPDKWIHKPWQALPRELEMAGVTLGETYPAPIVDHAKARREALAAFDTIKGR